MRDSDLYHLEDLAQEFLNRIRQGESPSLSEYVQRCPEHAEEIREIFPTLRVMEGIRPDHREKSLDHHSKENARSLPFDLGDYRVLREVGRGGMGIVYEAEQQALGRRVALKLLSDAASKKPKSLLRFQQEARSAGRMHHTNIVPVFDIGCEDGVYFYTMQLIDGESLDHVIVQLSRLRSRNAESELDLDGPITGSTTGIAESLFLKDSLTASSSSSGTRFGTAEAVAKSHNHRTGTIPKELPQGSDLLLIRNIARIGLQVAEALAYAHGQKVLHRDVKPANLLLDIQGTVWITDFGLARDDDQILTATGDLVGTLRYMAPERFHGTVDARGDVYSLGLTLYELLTLRTCLPRSHRSTPLRLDGPRYLPTPRECNSAIPLDLETIVLKAMEHDPRQRYARAEDLAEDLRRFMSDRPILARPVTTLERTWMWVLRNPRESTWMVALSLALLVLSAVGLFTYFLSEERDRARVAESNAVVARMEAMRAEREAQMRSLLSQAVVHQKSGLPGSRGHALDRIRGAATLHPAGPIRQELQRSAIIALATQDVRFERVPLDFEFTGQAVAFDLDNRLFVHTDIDGTIVLRNAQDFSELRRITTKQYPKRTYLRFSEKSTYLVAFADEAVEVYKVDSGEAVFVSKAQEVLGFDLSSDESTFALCTRAGQIELFDLIDKSAKKSVIDVDRSATKVAFSPNSQQILVGYWWGDKRPEIFDRKTLMRTKILSRASGGTMAIAWHPDGKRVALSNGLDVDIWDVVKGQRLRQLTGHRQSVDQVEFHPTAPLLKTVSWDGMSRLWDITSGHLIGTFVRTNTAISWDREDRMLGCSIDADHIDIIRQEPMGVLCHMDPDSQVRFFPYSNARSSTGQLQSRMVASTNPLAIVLCDMTTGRTLASLRPVSPCLAEFDKRGDSLWVASHEGLSRLPIRFDNGEAVIGPLHLHAYLNDWQVAEISKNGNVFAAINVKTEVLDVWDLRSWDDRNITSDPASKSNKPAETGLKRSAIRLLRYHDKLTVSPDGRWAATTFWHDDTVSVWDLLNGTLAHELVCGIQSFVAFSSDSESLVTCRSDAIRAYDLKTWRLTYSIPRQGCALPGRMAFSNNGKFVACEIEPGIIGLVELATGETLLQLQAPNRPSAINWIEFSRDDSRLHVATYEPSQISHWNLRNIRNELRNLGLDWNERLDSLLNDTPREAEKPKNAFAVRLEGVEAWQAPSSIGQMNKEQASRVIAIAENAWQREPESPSVADTLARLLLLAPLEVRDPTRAQKLAQFAMKKSPNDPDVINTLGLSQLRLGDVQGAIETVQRHLKLQSDTTLPFALYILAISMNRDGRIDESKTHLAWAVRSESAAVYATEEVNADCEALAEEARAILNEHP